MGGRGFALFAFHVGSALHQAYECLLEEMGEPLGSNGAVVLLVQLRTRSQVLRMTPAMAAGIADHFWSERELLEV